LSVSAIVMHIPTTSNPRLTPHSGLKNRALAEARRGVATRAINNGGWTPCKKLFCTVEEAESDLLRKSPWGFWDEI
jgi:hypothetical protein